MIVPELAAIIGLNESIVLQQIHYWLEVNKSTNKNFKYGYYWTYNTYEKWQEQFPFWCVRTIKSVFKRLEIKELIISDSHNGKKYDRTKWYRINYDKVYDIIPSCKCCTMDNAKIAPPIPESSLKDLKNDITNEKGQENEYIQKNHQNIKNQKDEVTQSRTVEEETQKNKLRDARVDNVISEYMHNLYPYYRKRNHPNLKKSQYESVYQNLLDFMNEYKLNDSYIIELANLFFCSNIDTDFNINHFATEGILLNRYYEYFFKSRREDFS